jgi:Tfp pilus assembly protein PilF/predicted Ser/Thr protein kinase
VDKIGRYELIRELGHGAMGRVFVARDPSLERSVALKLLAQGSTGARQRFHDEAKALAALSHPGIVTIYEVSEHEGQDFIAMEYLAGRTLRELLTATPRRTRGELVAICGMVAAAVGAAHRAGILHRDIKPENIIVTDAGDVKVVDFGIARRMNAPPRRAPTLGERLDELVEVFATTRVVVPGSADTELTPGTHTVFGTPAYMAPEVLGGGESSEASDVYSLGVTVYECIAGRRPYERATLIELMATVIDGSERPQRLADPLADLVDRMLAPDPAARPKLADIAAALSSAPPRRRRWPLAVGACVLAAGGGAGWFALHDRHAARGPHVIAIEPIPIAWSGPIPEGGDLAIANAIAAAAPEAAGLKVVGPDEMFAVLKLARPSMWQDQRKLSPAQLATAERQLGVDLAVRGKLDQRGDQLHGRLEVIALDRPNAVTVLERDVPLAELGRLELDLVDAIARSAGVGVELNRGSETRIARALTARGEQSLKNAAWFDARTYLEEAVVLDPNRYDAWHALALVLEWWFAPDDQVKAAIDHALALAPDETSKQLLTGISIYFQRDFRRALATLAPLEAKLDTLDDRQKYDLLYYLGETHWHAGRQSKGVAYFRRVLELDPRSSPAAIHPAEYALSHRDIATAKQLTFLQGFTRSDSSEFAIGNYEALAVSGSLEWRGPAQIVLGQKTTWEPPDNAIGVGSYRLARAVEAGDADAARRAIADVWQFIEQQGPGAMQPRYYYSLQMFGEVLACTSMTDDLRRLVTYLAKSSAHKPVSGYPRTLLLAAPLLNDRSLVVHDYFTDRLSVLADAADAELAGDRARAVDLLHQIVDDPSPTWDFPERAALLRNLRALGRTNEADALCADTLRPAVFRYAFMAVRKLCAKSSARRP